MNNKLIDILKNINEFNLLKHKKDKIDSENLTMVKIILYFFMIFLVASYIASLKLMTLELSTEMYFITFGILSFFILFSWFFEDAAKKYVGLFMYLFWDLTALYMMYLTFYIHPDDFSVGILFVFITFPIVLTDKYYHKIINQSVVFLVYLGLAIFFKEGDDLVLDLVDVVLSATFGMILGIFITSLKMSSYAKEEDLVKEKDNLTEVSKLLDFSLKTQKILSDASVSIQSVQGEKKSELENFFDKIRGLFNADLSFLLLIEGKGLSVHHRSSVDAFSCKFEKEYIPFGFLEKDEIAGFRESKSIIYSDKNKMENIKNAFFDKCDSVDFSHLIITPVKKSKRTIGAICIINAKVSSSVVNAENLMSISNMVADILKIDENNQFLERLTYIDEQSGLGNRNAYERLLSNTKHTMIEYNFGVIFIDMDKLKETNDELGHSYGDKLIKIMGDFILSEFPTSDNYRIGGDEFLVVVFNTNEKDFIEKASKFYENMKKHTELEASVGYRYNKDNINIENLVSIADKYMYRNKKSRYKGKRDVR